MMFGRLRPIWTAIRTHPIAAREPLRAAARVLWWQIRRRLSARAMPVPFVNGATFHVFHNRPASTAVWYYRLPDPDDMLFALHLLRPGDTFLDGGANVGVWSVLAASAGAGVVAVEPVPDTFAVLESELAVNRFPIPPRAVCAALAAEPGVVRMTADRDSANQVTTDGGVEVPARTLDDLTADTRPTLVKLDLEGYEYEALRGAGLTLRSPTLLALVIETFRRHNLSTPLLQNIERLLAEHGFHPFAYDPTGRRLTPLSAAESSGDSNNTIYIRDRAAVDARLAAAPPVVIGARRW
jgi:FkbM family methyltransferase